MINANFEDVSGYVVMRITNNTIHLHTKDAWDIVITRRSIMFEDAKKSISLKISQEEDLSMLIVGKLCLNGGLYVISAEQITSPSGTTIKNSLSEFNGHGVLLSPNRILF